MADKMSIDKTDHLKNESEDSMGSSPEGDHGQTTTHPQESQQPKRKGGRKPIYATSEERKQRNRQAQAAFRERRTEYIKQLEDTIKAHEQNTHNLQTAHRNAADECLMLRYKNSLLERILLEKGIDVQAELRAKTGSPSLGPTHAPQNLVQPPPIQRAMMKRHHQSRRSNSGIMPKIEPGISQLSPSHQAHSSAASPRSRPTPSEHANSPTSTATFASQPALSPTSSDRSSIPTSAAPVMKQQLSPLPIMHATSQQPVLPLPTATVRPSPSSSLYQTPSFQNHIEQLEQEYDAPADMIDDSELDTPSGPGPYPAGFPNGIQPAEMSPTASSPGSRLYRRPSLAKGQSSQQHYPSMTQLLDPALDWDPFGLSASMAFPTQFSFDQSNVR